MSLSLHFFLFLLSHGFNFLFFLLLLFHMLGFQSLLLPLPLVLLLFLFFDFVAGYFSLKLSYKLSIIISIIFEILRQVRLNLSSFFMFSNFFKERVLLIFPERSFSPEGRRFDKRGIIEQQQKRVNRLMGIYNFNLFRITLILF